MIWSIGITIEKRSKVEDFLKNLIKNDFEKIIKIKENFYDYFFDFEK